MNANPILLQKKYSRVIECFADKMNISLNAALDFSIAQRCIVLCEMVFQICTA